MKHCSYPQHILLDEFNKRLPLVVSVVNVATYVTVFYVSTVLAAMQGNQCGAKQPVCFYFVTVSCFGDSLCAVPLVPPTATSASDCCARADVTHYDSGTSCEMCPGLCCMFIATCMWKSCKCGIGYLH